MTHSRAALLELLRRHELTLGRALGQNYVADPNTVRRIARLSRVGPADHVVEVGAGVGSLTLALAETGARVSAIEVDRRVVPVLREVLAHAGLEPALVEVVEADALTLDWEALLGDRPAVLVANLPYNIAATLVLHLLETVPSLVRMLVMVQREVGERLAADAGSRQYGIPSVKRAWWAAAEVVGRVPASVFVPEPRVESVLVSLVRRPPPAADVASAEVFALVDAAFGQRRKMLRRSLAGVLPGTDVFDRASIDPTSRPEQLDVAAWARLARTVMEQRPTRPAAT